MDKVKNSTERLWYVEQAIENGWSWNILVLQIESGLYRRQGKAITNLARQLLKDPYNFDFLTLTKEAHERDLEGRLLA